MATTNTVTENIQPIYSSNTNSALAGGIQSMLGDSGYLNTVMSNWYDTAAGQGALGQYATYDQSQLDQYMNPYISNVIDANTAASNENLFNTIIPGVNSTFTGAGQFGSTRNGDFLTQAIQDQQQTLANTNATALYNAQNQANTNYLNWNQNVLTQSQNDLNNWTTQAGFPIGALNTLSSSANSIEPSTYQAQVTGAADSSDIQNWMTALGTASNAANDGSLNWLAGLWG